MGADIVLYHVDRSFMIITLNPGVQIHLDHRASHGIAVLTLGQNGRQLVTEGDQIGHLVFSGVNTSVRISDILLEDVIDDTVIGEYSLHSEFGNGYGHIVAFQTNDRYRSIVAELILLKSFGFWEVDEVIAIHGFPGALHAAIEFAEKKVKKKLKNTNKVTYRSSPISPISPED